MAIRGEFTEIVDQKTGEVGNLGYTGYIELGGFKGRVALVPRADTGGGKPDFDIHKLPQSRFTEVGAGWIKKKKNKPENFVSLSFTGEDFSRPFNAALMVDEPDEHGKLIMIYSAPRPQEVA